MARSRVAASGNEHVPKICDEEKGEVEEQSSVPVSVSLRAYTHYARRVRARVRLRVMLRDRLKPSVSFKAGCAPA